MRRDSRPGRLQTENITELSAETPPNTYRHFRLPLPATRNPAVLSGVLDPVRDSVFPVSSGDEFVARMTSVVTL